MESLFKYKFYEIGFTDIAFKKSDCSEEMPDPPESSTLEKVLVWKRYTHRKSTYFE